MTTALRGVEAYPRLQFTADGKERLEEISQFLDRTLRDGHGWADQAREDIHAKLQYLNDYCGAISEVDNRFRFRITIGRDFMLLSLTVTWEGYSRALDTYRFSMQGALIWHGGSNNSVSRCLEGQALWALHTQ